MVYISIGPKQFIEIPKMVGSVAVVGALTHYALLYFISDLKAAMSSILGTYAL